MPNVSDRFDEPVGLGEFAGRQTTIYLHVEIAALGAGYAPCLPLVFSGKYRHVPYQRVQGCAYVLVPPRPAHRKALGLFRLPERRRATERVEQAERIALVKGEHYPELQLGLLWECQPLWQPDPTSAATDPTLAIIWQGFERCLLSRFPTTCTLVAHPEEPTYHLDAYQAFLRTQGYHPISALAFVKEVRPREGGDPLDLRLG